MKTYRKTALIQAEQYLGQAVVGVCTGGAGCASKGAPNDAVPHIHTLEGDLTVSHGDWIATGVQGEHWAIKPDVFAVTYEEAAPGGEREPVAWRPDRAADVRKPACDHCQRMTVVPPQGVS